MKNFGEIKNRFNEILTESIVKKDDAGRKTFGNYIKMLKENVILNIQYHIFDNIENKYFEDKSDAKDYIKENISLLKDFTKEQIIEANSKLAGMVSFESGEDYEGKELHDNITNLIFTDKKAETLDSITESIHLLRDHMTTQRIDEGEKTEKIDLPPSIVSKMVINKFNTKYENISEDEKKIIKSILNGSEEDKKNLHTEMVRECVDTIDSKLDESDINLKGKLLSAKDKLLRMSYNEETYTSDISKIYNLKESVETE
jgi:hypothetical protein